MICKKCGKEIKEGNNFCTNCGTAVGSHVDDIGTKNRNVENSKKTTIIVAIIIAILFMAIGSIIIINSKTNDKVDNVEEKEEKVCITQNSEVSPTGKEFIGKFTSELKQTYTGNDFQQDGCKVQINDDKTVVNNMEITRKIYYTEKFVPGWYNISQEDRNYLLATGTYKGMVDKEVIGAEEYFFNKINNNLIAKRFGLFNVNTEDIESYVKNQIKENISIFVDNTNENINETYNSYIDNQEYKTGEIEDGNKKYSYMIIGNDLLCIYEVADKLENINIFFLAYDSNTNPVEIIKQWYKILPENQKNESTENTTENDLLKEIYFKYPELKDTEGIICTDGTAYWLLDSNGKKVYFESLTEFEEAYTKYYKNTETDVKNNSTTTNDDNYNYNNNNESYYNTDSSNNSNESSSINNINYKYTFSANENVVFKEKSSRSPVAYAIIKCQYCGDIITYEYNTSSEYRKYIFSETTKEYPQYLDASTYCNNCDKNTEAKIECNRVQE